MVDLSRLVAGSSTQYAVNAAAMINGSIPVTSATNTFSNVISGVTLTVSDTTTTAAEIMKSISGNAAGLTDGASITDSTGGQFTFAGNIGGRTRTLPLAVYLALDGDPGRAFALSLVLLAVSLAVIVGLRDRWLGRA